MTEVALASIVRWPVEGDSPAASSRWCLLAEAVRRLGFTGHDIDPETWAATTLTVGALARLREAVDAEAARERLENVRVGAGREWRRRPVYRARVVGQVHGAIDRVEGRVSLPTT